MSSSSPPYRDVDIAAVVAEVVRRLAAEQAPGGASEAPAGVRDSAPGSDGVFPTVDDAVAAADRAQPLYRERAQLAHDIGHANAFRTMLLALVAAGAVPDHARTEREVAQAQPQQIHHLLRRKIDAAVALIAVRHHRTYVGAGLALYAARERASVGRERCASGVC